MYTIQAPKVYQGNNRKQNKEEVQYFLGPYCANQGGQIHVGLFKGDTYTTFADELGYGGASAFKTISNVEPLPLLYSSASKYLVDTLCWSFQQDNENKYYDTYTEVEVSTSIYLWKQENAKLTFLMVTTKLYARI